MEWTGPRAPSPARMYDYYLGGKDNYAADRAAAEAVMETAPEAAAAARANRRFLIAAVRRLAADGIDQFVDIGAGIPTSPNVHEVALATRPSSRVVYVDNDPVVLAHTRALRAVRNDVVCVAGDVRRPEDILADPVLRRTINLARPVAVLMIALLHFLPDGDDPAGIVGVLHADTVPGSALAVSHATASADTWDRATEAAGVYTEHHATAPVVVRTPEQIRDLFGPWKVDGDLAPVGSWPRSCPVDGPTIVGAIARHG